MKVIGYARVSTEDQAREGVSLEAQQQAHIKAYCFSKGWQLVSVEADKGIGAKNLDRPELQRCLRAIEAHGVQA